MPPGGEAPGKVDAPVNLVNLMHLWDHLDNSSATHVTWGCQLALLHRAAKWNKHQRSGREKRQGEVNKS